jgi:hypothetical protein
MEKVKCVCPCGSDELEEVWSGYKRTSVTCYFDGERFSFEPDGPEEPDCDGIWFECYGCGRTIYDEKEFEPVGEVIAR